MSYERTAESDLEIIFEELDIQSVGNGYIDLICPKEKFGNGYYSEIYMESVIKFNSNEEFRKFLLEEYPNSDEYKPCYTPAFWIDFE